MSLLASHVVDPATGCWLWTRGKTSKGYGAAYRAGRQIPAHRAYYEALVGPIPAGLHLDHLCCTKDCVNPAHLEPVSNQENLRRALGIAVCGRGHSMVDGDSNVYVTPDGRRNCRACRRAATQRYDAQRATRAGRNV